MSERNVQSHGILPHGRIAHIGPHLRIETRKIRQSEQIVDARVDLQILHKKFPCDMLRNGIAKLYVLATEVGGIVDEGVAGDIVLPVGVVAQNRIRGIIWIIRSPRIVGDILYERLPHDGDEPESLIVVINLMVAHALKQRAEIEVVPAQTETDTIREPR